MAKSTDKPPTIQDLTREELLRLIPMIAAPLRVDPALILLAQAEVAADRHRAAVDAWRALIAPADQVFARWNDCHSRNAPQKVTDKAWRAYLTARHALEAARRKAERHWRCWERLTDQRNALTDREG